MLFDLPGPRFAGDDFEALRDLQFYTFGSTIGTLASVAVQRYEMAWRMIGCPADPVKDCLDAEKHFDASTLRDVHEILAAFWRRKNGYLQPVFPELVPLKELLADWQIWLFQEVRIWSQHDPHLIRHVCLILSQQNVVPGIMEEIDFGMEIAERYSPAKATEPDLRAMMRLPTNFRDRMIW